MSDLIADLRQKLADFEPLVGLGYFGGNELTSAAIDALPGLLDELEAARALIDNRQGLNSLDIVDVVAAYDQARANG